MVLIETGVFAFMIAFSFGFMIWGFLRSAGIMTYMLRIVSMAMFFGMALFISSGYGVAASVTETTVTDYEQISPTSGVTLALNSNSTITTYNTMIPEGDEGSWMGWIFLSFAFVNMAMLVKDMWGAVWK